jgi:hypothetical protein
VGKKALTTGLLVVGGALVAEHFFAPKGTSIASRMFGTLSGKRALTGWGHGEMPSPFGYSAYGAYGWPYGGGGHGGYPYG